MRVVTYAVGLGILLLAASGGARPAGAAVETANLLRNGDFEEAGTPPPGWRYQPGAGESCELTADCLTGKQGLRMSLPVAGTASVTSEPAAVTGGQDYLLTFWYHAQGMSAKPNRSYDGCDAGCNVFWQDAAGKQIGSDLSGLPYGPVADYQASTYTLTAPAGAAQATLRFYADVGAQYKGPPTALFFDQVRLMHVTATPAPAGAPQWVHAEHDEYAGEKIIDDPQAQGGRATLAPVGCRPYTPLTGGHFPGPEPIGEFLVTYRLKVADNTKTAPVVDLSVNDLGNVNYVVVRKTVRPTDFQQAGVYQDFTFRFIRPEDGTVSCYATYLGVADLTFDKVTVVEVTRYTTDKQLAAIWLGE